MLGKLFTVSNYENAKLKFNSLAQDNVQGIFNNFHAYENALLACQAYVNGSEKVTRQEWQDYIKTLRLSEQLSVPNGIGLVFPVP